MLPLYQVVSAEMRNNFKFLGHIDIDFANRKEYCGVFEYKENKLTYYFLDNEKYFKRDNLYGYDDDGERFAFFSKACIDTLQLIKFTPHVIHAHDWQAALSIIYLKTIYKDIKTFSKIKTLFTLHNINFQGRFPHSFMNDVLCLNYKYKNLLDYNGQVNLVKAAIEATDMFNTVSPTYAEEIKTAEFAVGLETCIYENAHKLVGILNGIDYKFYNPKTDKELFANYDKNKLEVKAVNKRGVQKLFQMKIDDTIPLLVYNGRLTEQKGIDLIKDSIEAILNERIQMIVMGNGEKRYENFFDFIEKKYQDKFKSLRYSNNLSKKIYAAADLVLMPSLFEPCGLCQMIASRYGTVPIVRETGGLKDSIRDFGCEGGGNGYTFKNYTVQDMLYSVRRGITDFVNDGPDWIHKMRICIEKDFSWKIRVRENIMSKKILKSLALSLIENNLNKYFNTEFQDATDEQIFKAIAAAAIDELYHLRMQKPRNRTSKPIKVLHYLTIEILPGKILKSALFNLGWESVFESALKQKGIDINKIYELESDAGLGNGGLGRLAACFMDSLATLDYPATAHCIKYDYGFFKQRIIDGQQVEVLDDWLDNGSVWLTARSDEAITVRFYGDVSYHKGKDGMLKFNYENSQEVEAIPYDMPLSGYNSRAISMCRLWSAKNKIHGDIHLSRPDYAHYLKESQEIESINSVLYPSNELYSGKTLRLKQQYFLCSASMQSIIKNCIRKDYNIKNLQDYLAIHINDTHPVLCIPELMRILMDEHAFSWDEAWQIVTKCVSYTNHTIAAEALEVWDSDLIMRVIPRIHQIICEINRRFKNTRKFTEDMAIVAGNQIRMANLAVHASNTVNGVAKIHTSILKERLFKSFDKISPEKIINITNGVTHRRWLCESNPQLCKLITTCIGDKFLTNAQKLEEFGKFKDDQDILKKLNQIKLENKKSFAEWIKQTQSIDINPESRFDVHIKRIHEYKRQLLNALRIIHIYNELKNNPNADIVPQTFIFSGKAAISYYMAKRIIKLINQLAAEIDKDKRVNKILKVVYVENFSVTISEKLVPATEVSQQISLAGWEASGTGNMKAVMNGALMMGTFDGANAEISECCGEGGDFIFGLSPEETEKCWANGYNPVEIYNQNPKIISIIDSLNTGFNGESFKDIASYLLGTSSAKDGYMCLADFESYLQAHGKMDKLYREPLKWAKTVLGNISNMGHFSSDRSIDESGKVTGRPGIILRNDWGGEITKNSNDFLIINQECFGGNFKGIIEKLAYIKSLGAKTIMLSPIFEANSYHKYNTANLDKIDEILGGETMFDVLVAEAKKYDIQILLDGVFNHCGNDSIYFKEAITNPKSEYYNWFVFEEYPNKYSSWWGFNTLPQFNESDTHLQNFIAGPNGIIAKYMKKEILGFRLDVADELTDPYLNKICAKIRQIKPDALITGEVWEDAATKLAYSKRRHYFGGHQFNSVMNYPLKNAIIDYVLNRNAEGLASTFFMLQDHYPEGVQHNLMNFLGTHDTIRILTALQSNNQGNGFKLLKIASAIQYCAPGVPSVFYGDEAGVIGGEAPFCRVCFPWGSENKEILKWYRKLGKLREMDVFIDGDCNVLFSHNGVFVFERKKTSTRIILAVNCGQEIFKLNLENSMVNFETVFTLVLGIGLLTFPTNTSAHIRSVNAVVVENKSDFTYTVEGTNATITGAPSYKTTSGVELIIPSKVGSSDEYTVTGIAASAFSGYTGLTSVTIPESVTTIGNQAFYGTTYLTTINFNATAVTDLVSGSNAFYNSGKTSGTITVNIGANVTKIPAYLFYVSSTSYAPKLIAVNFVGSSVCASIGTYAFANCYTLKSIDIPSSVTTIGTYAFYNCYGMTSATIPSSVATISAYSFYNCYGLTSLTIPNGVTNIDTNAFYNCYGLTSLSIANSVTNIGVSAFYNCYNLTSLTIPNSVKTVGSSAFASCTKIASLTISSGMTAIDTSVFTSCNSLTNITIPSNIKTIGNSAFQNCAGLTNLTLESGVTSIGSSAFQSCGKLASLTLPATVTTVSANAFYNCYGMTSIIIPSSVTSIGSQAFAYCYGLESITVDNANTIYRSEGNCLIQKSGNSLIQGCKDSIIPNSVQSIANYAFYYSTTLTNITIPSSVTSIGSYAFAYCTGLTDVTITDGVQTVTINTYAFQNCTSLKNITIPESVTSIGANAFYTCTSLATIKIPSKVTILNNYLFYGCTSLVSVTVPNGLTSIGSYAFYGCNKLVRIRIPSQVTTIGTQAFYNCTGLTSIAIPRKVTTISANAFYNCSSLVIYAEVKQTEQPSGWVSTWNPSARPVEWDFETDITLTLNYNYSGVEHGQAIVGFNNEYNIGDADRNYYTFVGWFSEPIGGVQYTDENGVGLAVWSEPVSRMLYAKWEWIPVYYDIDFSATVDTNSSIITNASTFEMFDENDTILETIRLNQEGRLNIYIHTGYESEKFKTWMVQKNDGSDEFVNLGFGEYVGNTAGRNAEQSMELYSNGVYLINEAFLDNYLQANGTIVFKAVYTLSTPQVVTIETTQKTFGTIQVDGITRPFGQDGKIAVSYDQDYAGNMILNILPKDYREVDTVQTSTDGNNWTSIPTDEGNYTIPVENGLVVSITYKVVLYDIEVIAMTTGEKPVLGAAVNNPTGKISLETPKFNTASLNRNLEGYRIVANSFNNIKILNHKSGLYEYFHATNGNIDLNIDEDFLDKFLQDGKVTIIALYVQQYELSVDLSTLGDHGSVSITVKEPNGKTYEYSETIRYFDEGSTVTIIADINPGSSIDVTGINPGEQLYDDMFVLIMNEDRDIAIVFGTHQYTLNAEAVNMNNEVIDSITLNPSETLLDMSSVKFSVTKDPSDNYEFIGWFIKVGNDYKEYTAYDPTSGNLEDILFNEEFISDYVDGYEINIYARFAKRYIAEISDTSGGKITEIEILDGGEAADDGETAGVMYKENTVLKINFTVDDFYHYSIDGLYDVETVVYDADTRSGYVIITVDGYRVVSLNFDPEILTVVSNNNLSSASGKINVITSSLFLGEKVIIAFDADSGHEITGWKINGMTVDQINAKYAGAEASQSGNSVTFTVTAKWLEDHGSKLNNTVTTSINSSYLMIMIAAAVLIPLLLIGILLMLRANGKRKSAYAEAVTIRDQRTKGLNVASMVSQLREDKSNSSEEGKNATALLLTGINLVTPRHIASVSAENGSGITYEFGYTGNIQEVTLNAGAYLVELWGADGGFGESYQKGYGGYSKGTLNVAETTTYYIGVGGMGKYKSYGTSTHSTSVNTLGGFNGGGSVNNSAASHGSGGGATHIATKDGVLSSLVNDKPEVIIVAGGAGGNGNWQNDTPYHGGGATGAGTRPGTQVGGGASAGGNCTAGTFGQGGNGYGSSGGGSGGGGGWYGGGSGLGGSAGGGGGSGYIGGVDSGLTVKYGEAGYAENKYSPKLRDGVTNYDTARQNGFVRIYKECITYTFNSDGQQFMAIEEEPDVPTLVIPSEIPTKTGYVFSHWSVAGDSTEYTDGMTYTNANGADVVFTAEYVEAVYDVILPSGTIYNPQFYKDGSTGNYTIRLGEEGVTLAAEIAASAWTSGLRWMVLKAEAVDGSDLQKDWDVIGDEQTISLSQLFNDDESSIKSSIEFINNYVKNGQITIKVADISGMYVVGLETNISGAGTFKYSLDGNDLVPVTFGNKISFPQEGNVTSIVVTANTHYAFARMNIYDASNNPEPIATIDSATYTYGADGEYDYLFELGDGSMGLKTGYRIEVIFEKAEYRFNIVAATKGQENNAINGLVSVDSSPIKINEATSFSAAAVEETSNYVFIEWKIYDHIEEKFVRQTGELDFGDSFAGSEINAAWLARYVKNGVVTVVAEYIELYHVQISLVQNHESFGELEITVDDDLAKDSTIYTYVDLFLVKGSRITIETTAFDLYEFDHFVNVLPNEIGLGGVAEIFITGDREITVAFKPKAFNIIFNSKDTSVKRSTVPNSVTYSAEINNTDNTGTISVNDVLNSLNADKEIPGYRFEGYTIGDVAGNTLVELSDNLLITEDIMRKGLNRQKHFVITANYTKTYALNISVSEKMTDMGDYLVYIVDDEGNETLTTLKEFPINTKLIIRAKTKNKYYSFKGFEKYDPALKELSITISSNHTVTLLFSTELITLDTDLDKSGSGKFTIDKTKDLKVGDSVMLTAAPDSGQEIKSWKVNGVSVEKLAKDKNYDVKVSDTSVTITLTSAWLEKYGTEMNSKVEFGLASATSTIIMITAIAVPLLLAIFLFYFINLRRKTALIKKELQAEYKNKQKFDSSSLLRDLREGKEIGVSDEAVKKAMKDKKKKPDSKN
ncbi:glycogen phosphorylase [Holotrichia oblita]|nr:glycogen phosphorylase [Holotrichia oblita]